MKIIKTEIVQTFEDGSKSTMLLSEKARQNTYEAKNRQYEHNLLSFEDGARIVYQPSWIFKKVKER